MQGEQGALSLSKIRLLVRQLHFLIFCPNMNSELSSCGVVPLDTICDKVCISDYYHD